jgi:AcrR family transcriptional regulator
MRRSKAREKILKVAEEMFKQVGYANLNMNKLAHEARVSVGTLYYHFPEGKISVLMEIRKRIVSEYEKIFSEKLETRFLDEVMSFDEGLEVLLETLIGVHREERIVLAAMESEVLSNLVSYDQVSKSVVVEELMESDARPVVDVLKALLRRYPEEDLNLDGKGARISKVVDVLIHKFVYLESLFGSKQEFIKMMVKIVRALLAR